MKKIALTGLIFGFAFPALLLAGESDSLKNYYQNLFLGERKTTNYYGALDPRSSFNSENGGLDLLDDQFKDHYLDSQIQPEAMDLHSFWSKEIISKSNCPDATLGENIDYIRYLFRLLSISYLFESLKMNHKMARELSSDKLVCSLSYDELFGKCRPNSPDMKKFQERVYGKFVNEISKINVLSFNKKEISEWLDKFQHSTSLTIDPVHARLHDWCFGEKKNCRSLSVDEIKKALESICNEDKNLIQNLCSENDSVYGMSYVEKASELIQNSNAFNLINRSGMGEECLHRYVKIFTPKESRYSLLNREFPLIYSFLIRNNSRYTQGELFLPGALKEFDIKGLSDFLQALKPPKEEPKVVIIKPKPKVILKPKVAVVEKPVIKPVAEPVKMEVVEIPKPKISEFESKLIELEEKKLESLSINMDNFRDDFEFTTQMVSDLSGPIKKFQTRSALNDMKTFDHLGSIEAPVGLIFLKFLIDTENHQGLYNIMTVIGEKFYVNNDIEKKDRPVLVELRNDSTTKNRWQIILLRRKK